MPPSPIITHRVYHLLATAVCLDLIKEWNKHNDVSESLLLVSIAEHQESLTRRNFPPILKALDTHTSLIQAKKWQKCDWSLISKTHKNFTTIEKKKAPEIKGIYSRCNGMCVVAVYV